MKKIGLFCVDEQSTPLMLRSFEKQINQSNVNFEIESIPFFEIFMVGDQFDCLLLGPQAKYNEKKIKKVFFDKEIFVLSNEEYLSKNVEKVLNKINLVFK